MCDRIPVSKLNTRIAHGDLSRAFAALYPADPTHRFLALTSGFLAKFGEADVALFSAPGRTELGGNHTDHQHGLVLTAAIQHDTIACAAPTDTSQIRVYSEGYPLITVDVSDVAVRAEERGTPAALIRGICRGFADRGLRIGGMDAYVTSCIPVGGGLSSSASFELLIATILNALYHDGAVSAPTLASIAQFAEHTYFGKPCGLLDQTAAAVGGVLFVDFADPSSPVTERLDFDFDRTGYRLYAVHTGGSHADLTADYAAITDDLAAVCACLGVSHLRSADRTLFERDRAAITRQVGARAVDRATHVFEENDRVIAQRAALKRGDFEAFLRLAEASGRSSRTLLRNIVSAYHPERTELADALDACRRRYGDKVVARVHGGGFAGTIQCYVPLSLTSDFVQTMSAAYGADHITRLSIRPCGGIQIREV